MKRTFSFSFISFSFLTIVLLLYCADGFAQTLPTAETKSATSVAPQSATLNGTVNANGVSGGSWWFEYGTVSGSLNSVTRTRSFSGTSDRSVNESVSGLTPGTTYFFRVVAKNNDGTANGATMSFDAPQLKPPVAVTKSATNVASQSATLNAGVNANGVSGGKWWFEYGTITGTFDIKTSERSFSGSTEQQVTWNISDLTPNTTYFFRVRAKNNDGAVDGSEMSFKTHELQPPSVTTLDATKITSQSATLNGIVNAKDFLTNWWFEWDEISGIFGNKTRSSRASGAIDQNVSASLSGLDPSKTYFYRLVAESGEGKTLGEEKSFSTIPPNPPTVVTKEATAIQSKNATLNGEVNAKGISGGSWWFEYGVVSGILDIKTRGKSFSGSTDQLATSSISALTPETTYFFRIVAKNNDGTVNGEEKSFSTLKTQPPVATTGNATKIQSQAATLVGKVDPKGFSTSWWFEWDTDAKAVNNKTRRGNVSGTKAETVNSQITGLTANTLYFYRLVAESSEGKDIGNLASFTTLNLQAPEVETKDVTNVESKAATLNGSINAKGFSTTWWFEWDEKSGVFGNSTRSASVSGSAFENVKTALSKLKPDTTYFYRVVGKSNEGKTEGDEKSFRTLSLQGPIATTKPATGIDATTATLNGALNARGISSTWWFEYGTESGALDKKVGGSSRNAIGGTTETAVLEDIRSLKPNTTYFFRLAASNEDGGANGGELSFATTNGLDAEFTAIPEVGIAPLEVRFADTSAGKIDAWFWDFGDGEKSEDESPTHIYKHPGTYSVELRISGEFGSDTEKKDDLISVLNPSLLQADFTADPTAGFLPLDVQFTDLSTGNPTEWAWDFGDGGDSDEQNPAHTYNKQGFFTVTLLISGQSFVSTEAKINFINVLEKNSPVADFIASATAGQAPLEIKFTDISEPVDNITSWAWDFGDGGTSIDQNPEHTYGLAGFYTVELLASNQFGADTEKKVNIIIVRAQNIPVAEFSANTIAGAAPLQVNFADKSQPEDDIASWVWRFGDGGISVERNPSHTYNTAGIFTVSLMAGNSEGADSETKTNMIAVVESAEAVNAGFSASSVVGVAPTMIRFENNSAGNVNASSWEFGDGSTGSQHDESHIYKIPGIYTVSLTVSGVALSDTEVKRDFVKIIGPSSIAAEFNASPVVALEGRRIQFVDNSLGDVKEWDWDFGDGFVSTAQNPTHTYINKGLYTVALNVGKSGATDSVTKEGFIEITDGNALKLLADFQAQPVSGASPLFVQFTDSSKPANNIESWLWDFGDGATDSSQNPGHTYVNDGLYTVSLTAGNSDESDKKTKDNFISVGQGGPTGDKAEIVVSFNPDPVPESGKNVWTTKVSVKETKGLGVRIFSFKYTTAKKTKSFNQDDFARMFADCGPQQGSLNLPGFDEACGVIEFKASPGALTMEFEGLDENGNTIGARGSTVLLEDKTGCIASVALGAENEKRSGFEPEELLNLRHFRDSRLKKSLDGLKLIRLYYKHSPEIIALAESSPELKSRIAGNLKVLAEIVGIKSLNGSIIDIVNNSMPMWLENDINNLIDDIAEQGSRELKEAISEARELVYGP